MFSKNTPKRIYLDYAAATPVLPQVLEAMLPYFSTVFGNAGAIHQEGVLAATAIDQSRTELARTLRIRPQGVVFTASGTESNNIAILGTLEAQRVAGVAYADMHIISTHLEHASVQNVLTHAQSLGVCVTYLETDEDGLLHADILGKEITPQTVLVTFAYVNSEIGVVQKVGKLARVVRAQEKEYSTRILVHVDAAQAPLWLPCGLDALLVDMLSLDAGKCYGPKGVGVLAMTHDVKLEPYLFGGSQEGGIRPGTENVPSIVGAVTAIVEAQANYVEYAEKISQLRDTGITLLEQIDGVVLNGSRGERVANNINISITGIDSEFAVISLDEQGIACATKSACGGAKGDGSRVVEMISKDHARATSTIRFTLGLESTLQDIETAVSVLRTHVEATRTAQLKLTIQ